MARVLIVDDAPFIRELLRLHLAKRGYEIIGEAIDGVGAVEIALSKKPDLILMDIVLPKKSGIQATEEILAKWPQAHIVAISTGDQTILRDKALKAGCKGFLAKPFEVEDLLKAIAL